MRMREILQVAGERVVGGEGQRGLKNQDDADVKKKL